MDNDARKRHFRFWNMVCRERGWRMAERRLQGDPDALGLFARRVWDGGTATAARAGRAPTIDDLRRALYWFAAGVRSVKQLNEPWQRLRVKGWLLLCLDDKDEEGHRLARWPMGKKNLESRKA